MTGESARSWRCRRPPTMGPSAYSEVASGVRGDRDPAARLLDERHVHRRSIELERRGDVVTDLHRKRLAERALVAEAREIDLQRFRLQAQPLRPVLDRARVEVRLVRDRAEAGELVADHLDELDAR